MFIRLVIPVVVLLIGWIGYSVLSVEKAKERRPEPKARVIRTEVKPLQHVDYQTIIHTQGVVRPHNEAAVTAQVSGQVKEIMPTLHDGAFFAYDDVLLELDDADFKTQVVSAQAQLARANAVFAQEQARAKQARLNWEDLGYDEEPNELVLRLPQLREAEANVKATEAELERARRDLQRTKIRAPFDGRVLQRTVAVGQSISQGTVLATVFQTNFVEVRLPIEARKLPFVILPESQEDPPVTVQLSDALHEEFDTIWDGLIVGTEGALDAGSRELFAIARIQDPFSRQTASGARKRPLRIGQPVRAAIEGRVLEDVYVIPRTAVRIDRIYLVDDAMQLERRSIEWVWEDLENFIVRDDTIPEGTLLATSRLIYTPNASKVEIIPSQSMGTAEGGPNLVTSQDGETGANSPGS